MEELDLDKIMSRLQATTGGDWTWCAYPTDDKDDQASRFRADLELGDGSVHYIGTVSDLRDPVAKVIALTGNGPDSIANMEFILNAKQDIVALVETVKMLRSSLARLREEQGDGREIPF